MKNHVRMYIENMLPIPIVSDFAIESTGNQRTCLSGDDLPGSTTKRYATYGLSQNWQPPMFHGSLQCSRFKMCFECQQFHVVGYVPTIPVLCSHYIQLQKYHYDYVYPLNMRYTILQLYISVHSMVELHYNIASIILYR